VALVKHQTFTTTEAAFLAGVDSRSFVRRPPLAPPIDRHTTDYNVSERNTRGADRRHANIRTRQVPASRAQRTQTAQRRAKAVQMRLEGAAHKDITRALEAAVTQQHKAVEILRQEELMRLDRLWVEVWAVLKREHVTVSNGKLVRGEDGHPLRDDGPVLQSVDRLVRILERRAKYLGLDAPQKHEVLTLDAIDRAIQELNAELGGAEVGEATGVAEAEAAQG
jgi:hypothetical protein